MKRLTSFFVTVALILAISTQTTRGDAVERMRMERLRATHEQVAALAERRRDVALSSDYEDCRALLHVHSAFSHDSNGSIDEIIAAARAVGARVVMFSEHPAPHYDYVDDGHRGIRDGVLLIPGAETRGFLAWPTRSIEDESADTPQAFSDLVRGTGGLAFVSHVEERMDWDIAGATGMEIYNTHADVKDEARLAALMRDPLQLASLMPAVAAYPQETFAAALDYPTQYLGRYDRLAQANARHGRGGQRLPAQPGIPRRRPGRRYRASTTPWASASPCSIRQRFQRWRRYQRASNPATSFWRSTSIPTSRASATSARTCWSPNFRSRPSGTLRPDASMSPSTGWLTPAVLSVTPSRAASDCRWGAKRRPPRCGFGPKRRCRASSAWCATARVIEEHESHELDTTVDEPGVYRVEVLLTLVGEPRPWILTNPFYVRPPREGGPDTEIPPQ
ncbi:MAG: hypothetical protein R3C10_19905 [Pirellulales bacterium]